MRFLLSFAVLALAMNNAFGLPSLPSSGTNNGLTMYNASSVLACGQQYGGCTIMQFYYQSSQNAAVFAGSRNIVYQVNFNALQQIGTLDICSDPSLNSGSGSITLLMNAQLEVTNFNIGNCGNVVTVGNPGQNAVVILVSYLYVTGSLNSNSYKVTSTASTVTSGANFNVGSLTSTGTVSFTGGVANMAVGFQNNAALTVTGTTVIAGVIYLSQNSQNQASVTCNSGGGLQSTGQFRINSPQQLSGCTVTAGPSNSLQTLEVVPAPASRKRDGSTAATVFSGGQSFANQIVQDAQYIDTLLSRKRAGGGNNSSASALPNVVSLINQHIMHIATQIVQQLPNAVYNPACGTQLIFGGNATVLAKECTGCVQNSTCNGSPYQTAPSAGSSSGGKPKRGDE